MEPKISMRAALSQREREIKELKDVLFAIGELAVVNWDDSIIGLVDKTLDGYKATEEKMNGILGESRNVEQNKKVYVLRDILCDACQSFVMSECTSETPCDMHYSAFKPRYTKAKIVGETTTTPELVSLEGEPEEEIKEPEEPKLDTNVSKQITSG